MSEDRIAGIEVTSNKVSVEILCSDGVSEEVTLLWFLTPEDDEWAGQKRATCHCHPSATVRLEVVTDDNMWNWKTNCYY